MKSSNYSAFETHDEAKFENNLITECRRNGFDGFEPNQECLLGNYPKPASHKADGGEEKIEAGGVPEMIGAIAVFIAIPAAPFIFSMIEKGFTSLLAAF